MKNGDKLAFTPNSFQSERGLVDYTQTGLTKREYFAGLAMQGLLASGMNDFSGNHSNRIAAVAIDQADELLRQLEKE